MSSKMTKVTRYKCAWCGQEFKTPTRHKCKWDVDAHNCLSCKHRGRFVKGIPPRFDPETLGLIEDGHSAYFECPYNDGGGYSDFDCGATSPDGHDCEHWEVIKDYKGKQSFVEMERKREQQEQSDWDDIFGKKDIIF